MYFVSLIRLRRLGLKHSNMEKYHWTAWKGDERGKGKV